MKDYHTTHRVEYERPARIGYNSITVLQELWGKPWDEMALSFVHALRPSCIRVTQGECTCDAVAWRVTVFVDENNVIQRMRQEVEVGLFDPITNGHHLAVALNKGMGSDEEMFWRQDPLNPITMVLYNRGEITKSLRDGTHVTFKPPGVKNDSQPT